MKTSPLRHTMVPLLAGLLLSGLWGGVSEAASAAEKRYAAAIAVETSGDLDGAERLYRQLQADYPTSYEAKDAGGQLERIALRRKQQHQRQFIPVLHRLRDIVLGYQEVTGQFPRQLADFDRDGFPFGSEDLVRSIPAGFVAYLVPQPEGMEFQVYALREGSDIGYLVNGQSAALQPVDGADFRQRHAGELSQAERKGNLLFLKR